MDFFIGIVIFFLSTVMSFGQDVNDLNKKMYYEVENELKEFMSIGRKFNQRIDKAIDQKSAVLDVVMDTIIKTITNTYIDDYSFVTINKDIIETKKISRPIFLMVTSIPSGEIRDITLNNLQVLNKIVSDYHDKIDFLFILINNEYEIEENLNLYNENISLIPFQRCYGSTFTASSFSHHTWTPAIYLIDANKKIVSFGLNIHSKKNYLNYKGEKRIEIFKKIRQNNNELYEKLNQILE